MRHCLAVACLISLTLSLSITGTAQAPPSADSYVTTIQPGANFGSSALLPVQNGTTSFIKFNLGAFPPNSTIAKATLRLYVNAVAAPGSFDVYQLESGWSEKGITFNSAPVLGASATGNQPVSVTSPSLSGFILIDITPLAQGWLNGSVPNYGVALALASSGGSFSFDSKESTGTGHQPELEIVFGNVTESPAVGAVPSRAPVTKNQPVVSGVSDPFVDNGTALQVGANFNIDGSGSATSFNAQQYALAGTPVLGSNGTSSLFVGPGAGQGNTGSQNTFAGVSAGQANTTGSYNSFIGNSAGYSNTTGILLTFLGMQSGYSNTTGANNSFVGANSGYANTTGVNNSFLGTGAGRSNTTGSSLTFLGMQSGFSNTNGSYNSFVGNFAGYSNTTGVLLTFLGMQSGYSNTTGVNNSFVGANSGYSNTTGFNNSFLGTGAGRSNTTGNSLTFLGMQSGFSNTSGSFNSFIGNFAGVNNTAGNNNTFVGYNAGRNADSAANNNLYISSLGAAGDSGTIRIGDPVNQTVAYMAGISGSSTISGVPVFVDSSGKLGTTGSGINFTQLSGSLANAQLGGNYGNAVNLLNVGNSFAGNGAGLGNVNASLLGGFPASAFAPAAGSGSYVQNGNTPQAGTNFNIDGNGTVGGTLNGNAVSSGTNYRIGSGVVLGVGNAADQNLFVGSGAGTSNTSGSGQRNTFAGFNAGLQNTTGKNNTFSGASAGSNTTTGSFNTFVGNGAGSNVTTGSSDLYIANDGCGLPCTENNTIRIGTQGIGLGQQNATYIAGIYGNAPSGALPVVINANGQLGTTTAAIGVTTFNGRTGAVVPAANDYSFSQLSGSVSFNQVTGTVNSSQIAGTYPNPVVLSNTGNAIAGAFTGTFTGDGSRLTGIGSGLNWPVVTKSADYSVQLSDFATPATRGNYVVLTGTVSHTFTLPNPPPPNGYCVAIGNVADAGINSGTNVFLTVSPHGLLMDNSATVAFMPRRTAYLYCSDGSASYYRLGYQQNGVNQIGPWIKTLDTGTVNAMTTTFRNGMDAGVVDGSTIFLLPKFANTSNIVTLNVNGLGAFRILRYGSQGLAPGDLSPNAYALLIFNAAGSKWELLNPQSTQTFSGTTASIGGSPLTAGTCTAGAATVNGATIGHPVSVSASDGSLPDDAIMLRAAVTTSNTVTVQLCAIAAVTPAAKTYNVLTQ